MAKNEKQEWITTKIPKDIADEIEILLKNRKLGYNSKTGFIADALREKIDELGGKSKKHQTKMELQINTIQENTLTIAKLVNQIAEMQFKNQEPYKGQLVPPDIFSILRKKLKTKQTPEYQKEEEQKRRKKIQSSKEIKKLAGPKYVVYDQDKSWIEREKENNKIQTLDGTKEKELSQTLNDILGGVDSTIIEEIKNQIKELNKSKPLQKTTEQS